MGPIRRIVVATDFSDCSRAAVELARELAQSLHVPLDILHVWEITPLLAVGLEYSAGELVTAIEEAAEKQLEETVARVKAKWPETEGQLRSGIGWEEIVRGAKEKGADLLVLGTHGRAGLNHLLMGSVAEKVVRTSPIPVLTVPQPKAVR